MSEPALWRVSLMVAPEAVEIFESALTECCEVVGQRLEDGADVALDGWSREPPDAAMLAVEVALAAAAGGVAVPAFHIEPIAARNWLAENRGAFAAFRLGRFFIHEHDDASLPPPATIAIAVDAGLAFGSGRHASTAGCLAALEGLRGQLAAGVVLDLGCGSGLLAIAAARWLHRRVVASDIDPVAARIAGENAARNGVRRRVQTVVADGLAEPRLRAAAPYALVFANILARPLQRLARGIVVNTAPGGVLVLAGFITRDAPAVFAVYRALGCRLRRHLVREGWTTLVLQRTGSRR